MKQNSFPTDNMEYYRKPSWIKYTIYWLVLCLCMHWLLSCSTQRSGCRATRGYSGYSILKWHTDKRGLTSVVWRDNSTGKEWGLDYATRDELRAEGLIK